MYPDLKRGFSMHAHELVSKLIDLQEKANSHATEYLKLRFVPGKKTMASVHHRKAERLRLRIQKIIREIAGAKADNPLINQLD